MSYDFSNVFCSSIFFLGAITMLFVLCLVPVVALFCAITTVVVMRNLSFHLGYFCKLLFFFFCSNFPGFLPHALP